MSTWRRSLTTHGPHTATLETQTTSEQNGAAQLETEVQARVCLLSRQWPSQKHLMLVCHPRCSRQGPEHPLSRCCARAAS